MLTKLRWKIQKLLAVHAKAAQKLGFTPNTITVIGVIVGMLAAHAYALSEKNSICLLAAAALTLLSGYFDALDGAVARQTEKATAFGGYLDSLLDRYTDAIIYFAIIISKLCETALGIAALIGTLLVSYVRARAESMGIKMETVGIAERPERISILVAATLATYFWQPALKYAVLVLAILTNITVLQRTVHIYKKLKARNACGDEADALHEP